MSNTPKHVAIIMDGNGRWAKQRSLPRVAGHEAGAKSVEKIIQICIEKKVQVLTLFAFGLDNWGRPQDEVSFLMKLFLKTLKKQTKQLKKNNIKLRIIGDYSRFSAKLCTNIEVSQAMTASNTGLVLVIAANYSGRWDLLQATQKICAKVTKGELSSQQISYPHIQNELCLSDLPEPDLFIRTSGEQRISNFMLWQLAYTEFYFTDTLWPDFNQQVFDDALKAFAQRQRRYGLISEQLEEMDCATISDEENEE